MSPDLKSVALLLLVTLSAPAQTSLVSGALDGSVSDSNGGRIPGAVVTARDLATGQTREVSTDGEGVFRVAALPVGTYEVLVSQPGFAPYRHAGVTLALGSTVHVDIVLETGGVTSQV